MLFRSAGLSLSEEDIQKYLDRRRPGQSQFTTSRNEGDRAEILSGVFEGVVEKRMEMAYRLLQSGKYKVKDVVWMVGYSNTSHFIDVFRKRYGVTPGEI